jgi:beta-lactamase superfamily II metal-dependent hydrolase
MEKSTTKPHTKALIILSLISLLIFLTIPALAGNLRIYHIDVEQGDATLFISPNGKTLLVDSGGNGKGERIKAVMQDAGVSKIDHFLCTHYHDDHYGGIDELADDPDLKVGKSYDRGDKAFIPESKKEGDRF